MRAGQEEKRDQLRGSGDIWDWLDAHCSIGDGERWSDSRYILEVKLTGCADG